MAKIQPKAILIPILSKRENKPDFLMQCTGGVDQVVLLSVIDQREMVGPFGFSTNEIRLANQLMQQITVFLSSQGKEVESILEWGTVSGKIVQLAELKNCSRIVFVRQDNEYYKNLVKQVKVATRIEVEEVLVPFEETRK